MEYLCYVHPRIRNGDQLVSSQRVTQHKEVTPVCTVFHQRYIQSLRTEKGIIVLLVVPK